MDKLKHFILCLVVTFVFGWEIGVTVGITIELTQAEYGGHHFWKQSFWKRLLTWDTFFDLTADGLGVFLGMYVRTLI